MVISVLSVVMDTIKLLPVPVVLVDVTWVGQYPHNVIITGTVLVEPVLLVKPVLNQLKEHSLPHLIILHMKQKNQLDTTIYHILAACILGMVLLMFPLIVYFSLDHSLLLLVDYMMLSYDTHCSVPLVGNQLS